MGMIKHQVASQNTKKGYDRFFKVAINKMWHVVSYYNRGDTVLVVSFSN